MQISPHQQSIMDSNTVARSPNKYLRQPVKRGGSNPTDIFRPQCEQVAYCSWGQTQVLYNFGRTDTQPWLCQNRYPDHGNSAQGILSNIVTRLHSNTIVQKRKRACLPREQSCHNFFLNYMQNKIRMKNTDCTQVQYILQTKDNQKRSKRRNPARLNISTRKE